MRIENNFLIVEYENGEMRFSKEQIKRAKIGNSDENIIEIDKLLAMFE